jgi:hypothetical protein
MHVTIFEKPQIGGFLILIFKEWKSMVINKIKYPLDWL